MQYRKTKKRLLFVLVTAIGILFTVSLFMLGTYFFQYLSQYQNSEDLRSMYYSAEQKIENSKTLNEINPTINLPTFYPSPTLVPLYLQSEFESAVTAIPGSLPTVVPSDVLPMASYTNNPYLRISTRFNRIRNSNKDIVGWLTLSDLLDEAVVQRDSAYYLKRDYKGYHNVNGALFLEETINLKSRPYSYIIYGHNMKTGAMFGCLRNYESLNFVKSSPFIRFDTMYEDGEFVVFAVGSFSTKQGTKDYLDLTKALSYTVQYRMDALQSLTANSVFRNTVEVTSKDQLLLLVTCCGDEEERRFVAARRIRNDETEDQLRAVIEQMRAK